MKKIVLVTIIFFNLLSLTAQKEISIGLNFGVPVGKTDEYASFVAGFDAEYVYDFSDQTFYAGIAAGFISAFTKDITILNQSIEVEDVQYAPIAAAARYFFNDTFYGGVDLGYALGINDGNEGGLYYKPKMGFGFTDHFYVNISFTGVVLEDEVLDDYKTTQLGIEYRF